MEQRLADVRDADDGEPGWFLLPAVGELRVVRPAAVYRVGLPVVWIALGLFLIGTMAAIGGPGLWIIGVLAFPVFVLIAAIYATIRFEVEGERARIVWPFGIDEFDRRAVRSVSGSLVLLTRQLGRIELDQHAEVRKIRRRHPEGRCERMETIAIPGLPSRRVAHAIGFPIPEHLSGADRARGLRRAFRGDDGKVRPLTYAYATGIVLMVLCYAFRVDR